MTISSSCLKTATFNVWGYEIRTGIVILSWNKCVYLNRSSSIGILDWIASLQNV